MMLIQLIVNVNQQLEASYEEHYWWWRIPSWCCTIRSHDDVGDADAEAENDVQAYNNVDADNTHNTKSINSSMLAIDEERQLCALLILIHHYFVW